MSADVLRQLVASARDAVDARRGAVPLGAVREAAHARTDIRDFRRALSHPDLAVIAEHKRASPSAGVIRADLSLPDVVSAYERAGAGALSVLTEESRFGGRLTDLYEARNASELPILRKDFTVDEYQVYEAAAAGADAVLLIVAALEVGPLADLHTLAGELGLAALVEVHDERELELAAGIGARIIGINNRNLATLEVDVQTSLRLVSGVPDGVIRVAESGLRTREQLQRLADAGFDAVLVGESLMRAPDIQVACRELTGVLGSGA